MSGVKGHLASSQKPSADHAEQPALALGHAASASSITARSSGESAGRAADGRSRATPDGSGQTRIPQGSTAGGVLELCGFTGAASNEQLRIDASDYKRYRTIITNCDFSVFYPRTDEFSPTSSQILSSNPMSTSIKF